MANVSPWGLIIGKFVRGGQMGIPWWILGVTAWLSLIVVFIDVVGIVVGLITPLSPFWANTIDLLTEKKDKKHEGQARILHCIPACYGWPKSKAEITQFPLSVGHLILMWIEKVYHSCKLSAKYKG